MFDLTQIGWKDGLVLNREIIGFNTTASIILLAIFIYTLVKAKNLKFVLLLSTLLFIASVSCIPIGIAQNWEWLTDVPTQNKIDIYHWALPLMCFASSCNQIAHWIFSQRYWEVAQILKKYIQGGLGMKESVVDKRVNIGMHVVMIGTIIICFSL